MGFESQPLPTNEKPKNDLTEEWKKHLEENPPIQGHENDTFRSFLDKQEGKTKTPEQVLAESNLRTAMDTLEKPSNESPIMSEEVFKKVLRDLNQYKGNENPLKYTEQEILELAINSDNAERYEVLEARNGHYFLTKVDNTGTIGTFLLSTDPRNIENPNLIVCSAEELESWLKK